MLNYLQYIEIMNYKIMKVKCVKLRMSCLCIFLTYHKQLLLYVFDIICKGGEDCEVPKFSRSHTGRIA